MARTLHVSTVVVFPDKNETHSCLETGNSFFFLSSSSSSSSPLLSRLFNTFWMASYDLINFQFQEGPADRIGLIKMQKNRDLMSDDRECSRSLLKQRTHTHDTLTMNDEAYIYRHEFVICFLFFLAIDTSATSCSSCFADYILSTHTHTRTLEHTKCSKNV